MKHADHPNLFSFIFQFLWEIFLFSIYQLEVITKLTVKNMSVFNHIQFFLRVMRVFHTDMITVVQSGFKQTFS